jgi:hypothetical protein
MNWVLIAEILQQLLPVVLKSVELVEQGTGKPTAAAVAEVVDHLTPGAPNSPVLSAGKEAA